MKHHFLTIIIFALCSLPVTAQDTLLTYTPSDLVTRIEPYFNIAGILQLTGLPIHHKRESLSGQVLFGAPVRFAGHDKFMFYVNNPYEVRLPLVEQFNPNPNYQDAQRNRLDLFRRSNQTTFSRAEVYGKRTIQIPDMSIFIPINKVGLYAGYQSMMRNKMTLDNPGIGMNIYHFDRDTVKEFDFKIDLAGAVDFYWNMDHYFAGATWEITKNHSISAGVDLMNVEYGILSRADLAAVATFDRIPYPTDTTIVVNFGRGTSSPIDMEMDFSHRSQEMRFDFGYRFQLPDRGHRLPVDLSVNIRTPVRINLQDQFIGQLQLPNFFDGYVLDADLLINDEDRELTRQTEYRFKNISMELPGKIETVMTLPISNHEFGLLTGIPLGRFAVDYTMYKIDRWTDRSVNNNLFNQSAIDTTRNEIYIIPKLYFGLAWNYFNERWSGYHSSVLLRLTGLEQGEIAEGVEKVEGLQFFPYLYVVQSVRVFSGLRFNLTMRVPEVSALQMGLQYEF